MKIISNFRDYYDKALEYGQDETIKYVRISKVIEVEKGDINNYITPTGRWKDRLSWFNSITISINKEDYFLHSFILGFCGELHFGLKLFKTTQTYKKIPEFKVFYSFDEFKKFCDKNEVKDHRVRPFASYSLFQEIEIYFALKDKKLNNYLQSFFHEYNVPIFIIEKTDYSIGKTSIILTLNPNLIGYKVVQLINPYIALQELSMYVGGVLLQQTNPMVSISNDDMIEKKGFDKKLSFRKGKEK